MGYTDSLAHYYDMSVPVGLPDLGIPGGNPGVGANIVSNPNGIGGGRCAEFNGNNSNYNLSDVAELNAVPTFTLAFWMNQDVIDQNDIIFSKRVGTGADRLICHMAVDGNWYFEPHGAANRGRFDYSAVVNAGEWRHVAMVFNGAGLGNTGRLQVYVDAALIALTFVGTIAAVTADLSGDDAYIGAVGTAFDGKIDSFAIFTDPLTQLSIADLMIRTRRGVL